MKQNIKYSPFKMWYVACLVRGMSIDEALKQLSFCSKKGATDVKQTILEAQEMAVKSHNVEFKSNLWVGECFSTIFFDSRINRFFTSSRIFCG
jgi:large subunit ribosomal protein L22